MVMVNEAGPTIVPRVEIPARDHGIHLDFYQSRPEMRPRKAVPVVSPFLDAITEDCGMRHEDNQIVVTIRVDRVL
jgi:hypothetical protein